MIRAFYRSNSRGFTLVEIMITILIISILVALAVPAFIGARERSQGKTCGAQLRQIRYSKEAWAMDNRQPVTATPVWNDLYPGYLKERPQCPAGGNYDIRAVNEDPLCSQGGTHTL